MEQQAWKGVVYKPAILFNITSEEWAKCRRGCLRRDNYRCRRCGKRKPLVTAHHIVPRDEGGSNDLTNLISLCTQCHDYVEVEGFRTLAEIECLDDEPIRYAKDKGDNGRVEDFERPDWHKWVYGGQRRPN